MCASERHITTDSGQKDGKEQFVRAIVRARGYCALPIDWCPERKGHLNASEFITARGTALFLHL